MLLPLHREKHRLYHLKCQQLEVIRARENSQIDRRSSKVQHQAHQPRIQLLAYHRNRHPKRKALHSRPHDHQRSQPNYIRQV